MTINIKLILILVVLLIFNKFPSQLIYFFLFFAFMYFVYPSMCSFNFVLCFNNLCSNCVFKINKTHPVFNNNEKNSK